MGINNHHSNADKRNSAYQRRTRAYKLERRSRVKEGISQRDYPSKERVKGKPREKYRYQPEAES